MILDAIREFRIRYHLYAGISARNESAKKRHFEKMTTLIRKRSPEQVKRMEKARGLV